MGGRPLMAVNLAAWPGKDLDVAILGQVLLGGAEIAREAGCYVAGGHTIDDPVPKYGMAVTGLADPGKLMTIDRAQPGDRLILTKAIGTGVVATAHKRDGGSEAVLQAAVDSMTTLNAGAAEAALKAAARVHAEAVPLLPGAAELARDGYISGGTRANTDRMRGFVSIHPLVADEVAVLLHDAQ